MNGVAVQLIVEFGGTKYTLERLTDHGAWIWWLSNGDGEGMSLNDKNFFDMLDKEFKENF
jgi:hypothetical protein